MPEPEWMESREEERERLAAFALTLVDSVVRRRVGTQRHLEEFAYDYAIDAVLYAISEFKYTAGESRDIAYNRFRNLYYSVSNTSITFGIRNWYRSKARSSFSFPAKLTREIPAQCDLRKEIAERKEVISPRKAEAYRRSLAGETQRSIARAIGTDQGRISIWVGQVRRLLDMVQS